MQQGATKNRLAASFQWFRGSLLVFAITGLSACESQTQAPEDKADFAVVEATISDVQKAITSGQESCRSIVESYIARIDAYDQSTKLNAVVFKNPRALARADEIDAALAEGKDIGPLFCAPLLVKDNFDTHTFNKFHIVI